MDCTNFCRLPEKKNELTLEVQLMYDHTLPYWKQFSKANKWGMGTRKNEDRSFLHFCLIKGSRSDDEKHNL